MSTLTFNENQKFAVILYLVHPIQTCIICIAIIGLIDGIAFFLPNEIAASVSLLAFALVAIPAIISAAFDPKVGLCEFLACCVKNSWKTLRQLSS